MLHLLVELKCHFSLDINKHVISDATHEYDASAGDSTLLQIFNNGI